MTMDTVQLANELLGGPPMDEKTRKRAERRLVWAKDVFAYDRLNPLGGELKLAAASERLHREIARFESSIPPEWGIVVDEEYVIASVIDYFGARHAQSIGLGEFFASRLNYAADCEEAHSAEAEAGNGPG